MLGTTIDIPNGVSLLADHLDAALAAGEDLLAARHTVGNPGGTPGADETATLARFVIELRRHETTVIARLLQARRRALEIERFDRSTQIVVNLFLSNTSGLMDLVATFGDTTMRRFDGSDEPHAFLRRRGLLGQEAASLPKFSVLTVKDSYLVGGVLQIGGLLDMCSSFLDLLDRRYGLYPDDDSQAEESARDDFAHVKTTSDAETGDAVLKSPPLSALEDVLAEMRKGGEH